MKSGMILLVGLPKQTLGVLTVLVCLGNLAIPFETFAVSGACDGTRCEAVQHADTADHHHAHPDGAGASSLLETEATILDATVAAQFTPLRFTDVFVTPAGPKGLEYTTNILALRGKPVRMTGFMVRHVNKDPAVFMLTEFPVSTMEHEYGTVDSIPPNVVHVLLPEQEGVGTGWQPYAVTVYGRLELDRREETDGRVSYARVKTYHITVGSELQVIDVMRPLDERDVNLGAHRHQH